MPKGKPLYAVFLLALSLGVNVRNGAGIHSGEKAMKEGDEGWLDFKAIKEKADVRAVLSEFGLLEHLEERGAELVGWCPFGDEHGKKDSFSFNAEKKTFQCFSCKARGSLLDFVAKFQNVDLRVAAQWVHSFFSSAHNEVKEEANSGRPYSKGRAEKIATITNGETPKVMTFSIASRLIIGKKINPDNLLVVDVSGIDLNR